MIQPVCTMSGVSNLMIAPVELLLSAWAKCIEWPCSMFDSKLFYCKISCIMFFVGKCDALCRMSFTNVIDFIVFGHAICRWFYNKGRLLRGACINLMILKWQFHNGFLYINVYITKNWIDSFVKLKFSRIILFFYFNVTFITETLYFAISIKLKMLFNFIISCFLF